MAPLSCLLVGDVKDPKKMEMNQNSLNCKLVGKL